MKWATPAYLAKIARSLGCPEMWVEDACQEMRLRLWRADVPSKRVAKRACIDFIRRVVRDERYDHAYALRGLQTLEDIDRPAADPYAAVDQVLDFRARWHEARATPGQRRALARRLAKDHMSESDCTLLYQLRQKLRR